jgi:hypothetical protein
MKTQCGHQCAKFCNALEESIRRETTTLEYYRSITVECDFPEIRLHFQRLAAERESLIATFRQKLNEVQLERDITDQIGSSFA